MWLYAFTIIPLIFPSACILINESLYPSTYIFGGPDKILLQTNISIVNTLERHYYLDCRCIDDQQQIDSFSFLDRVGREFTYHIRIILSLQIFYFIVFYYFDTYIKKYIFSVEIFSFWIIFAGIFIVLIQDTSCSETFHCENSVWARETWGWCLIAVQCLYVFYLEYFWKDEHIKRCKRNLQGFNQITQKI